MHVSHKDTTLRWAFAALAFLAASITLTLFAGLRLP
jgi:hypothetical protein